MSAVVYAGFIAVETDSILIAAKVAGRVAGKNAVRGRVSIAGKKYRWSTIQQFAQHGGFSADRTNKGNDHE